MVAFVSLVAIGGVAAFTTWNGSEPPGKRPRAVVAKPVRVAAAHVGTIELAVEYRGEIVTNAAELSAQSAGRLVDVTKSLGDGVKKGELLARVDASEGQRLFAEAVAQVRTIEATRVRAEAQLAAAREDAVRAERLASSGVGSDQEAEALRAQVRVLEAEIQTVDAQKGAAQARAELYRTQISEARLVAPFDGAVAERYLDVGATVQLGTPILRLVENGALRVRFRASEKHVDRVEPGARFVLRTIGTGDATFGGAVSRLSAEVSRTDRTIAVEGTLDEASDRLKPGMYATLTLQTGKLEDRVLVPSSAVSSRYADDGREEQAVFVVGADSKVERRVVDVLGKAKGLAAVTGVAAGERVVALGHEELQSGALVKVIEGR